MTQSQEANSESSALPSETQSQLRESAPFTAALRLSVNTESSEQLPVQEDSQATQIEELEEPLGVDASDSGTSGRVGQDKGNAAISELQTAESSRQPSRTERTSESDSQKQNVNEMNNTNHSDGTLSSCVQETPCSLPSPLGISQSPAVQGSPVSSREVAQTRSAEHQQEVVENRMEVREQEDKEEVVMEEEENTGGASGIALVLSQSQMMSPEPMEEEEREEEIQDNTAAAASSSKTGGSEPVGLQRAVTADGHQSQTQEERADVPPGGLSQAKERTWEADGVKDKSLSDSSGGERHVQATKPALCLPEGAKTCSPLQT